MIVALALPLISELILLFFSRFIWHYGRKLEEDLSSHTARKQVVGGPLQSTATMCPHHLSHL